MKARAFNSPARACLRAPRGLPNKTWTWNAQVCVGWQLRACRKAFNADLTLYSTPTAMDDLDDSMSADDVEVPVDPKKGDSLASSEPEDGPAPESLPDQEEFWRPPVRFGSVPVEQEPLGWDRRQRFRKLFSFVSLPMQVVDPVSFGHAELEPNRLFGATIFI